jgi:hypothetical protein
MSFGLSYLESRDQCLTSKFQRKADSLVGGLMPANDNKLKPMFIYDSENPRAINNDSESTLCSARAITKLK